MLLIRTLILAALVLIGLSSCGHPPGFDRPMNRQRLHGFHRGPGYGHGPGTYRTQHSRGYRHYGH